MPQDKYVKLRFDDWKHSTDKSHLFVIDDQEVWIPKSVIEDLDDANGIVLVAEWWASKEGLD